MASSSMHLQGRGPWGFREDYVSKMRAMLGGWGTVGETFSFATMMLHLRTGERLVTGFVSRSGREEDIEDVVLYPTMADDMLSPVAGIMLLTLESGEAIRLEGKLAQSYAGYGPGTAFSALGALEQGGRQGFMNLSLYANPWSNAGIPPADAYRLAAVEPGLSDAADQRLP